MNTIKVSVLVPVYGVEKYIERCAISLFEQTMKTGIEYIFVNDCTKDKSIIILQNILENYPERKPFVKIINHETNQGLASARNTGLDNASGEYICIVDADDYIDLKMLQILYEQSIKTDADIVICNSLWQHEEKTFQKSIKKRNTKQEYLTDILDRTSSPAWWGRLYKREIIEKNHIRLPAGFGYGEDYTTVPIVLYYADKIELVNEHLYHYVQYNNNSYTRQKNPEYINILKECVQLLENFFEDKELVYKSALNRGKFNLNMLFLRTYRNEWQKKGFNMFPDVNNKEYYKTLNIWRKCIYKLAASNQFRLANVLLKIGYL